MKSRLLAASGIVLLSGCMQAQEPKQVAQQYWQAMQTGDTKTARTLVSAGSQEAFDAYVGQPDQNRLTLNAVALTDSRTTVTTIVNSGNTSKTFDTVLVLQNGQWVVDAQATQIPPPPGQVERRLNEMADKLSSEADKSMEKLEQSINEGVQLLDELLHDSSREMGNTLNKGMQDFSDSLNEAIEKLKQRRQQQQAPVQPAPAQPATPDQGDGEGVI